MNKEKIIPTIYVMTDKLNREALQFKIGIVQKQLVETRRKQFDTTFQSSGVELIDFFPIDLSVKTKELIEKKSSSNKSYVEIIENTIHNNKKLVNFRKEWCKVKKSSGLWSNDIATVREVILETIDNLSKIYYEAEKSLPLRYYQARASNSVFNELVVLDKPRASIIHCTRSGKTWTGIDCFLNILRNSSTFKNNIYIQLEPNSMLVTQNAYNAELRFKSLGVNVKSYTIGGDESREKRRALHARISEHSNSYVTLITCTYQSISTLKKQFDKANVIPDFMFCDEAHRLTGKQTKVWKNILDDSYLKVSKRLCVTASPVFFYNSDTHTGFEDEKVFGRRVDTYTMSDAQLDGYLAPVEVLGFKIDQSNADIIRNAYESRRQIIQQNLFNMYNLELSSVDTEVNRDEGDLIFFMQLYNVISAIKSGLVTHPIIYCNTINRSKIFLECLVQIAKQDFDLDIEFSASLDSSMSIRNRDKLLKNDFANAKVGVITNVQCLKEGIDVSAIDSVFFVDRRSSGTDIIQIFGRPLNFVEGKTARIFLPILIEKNEIGLTLNEAHYKETLGWIKSLLGSQGGFDDILTSVTFFDPQKALGNVLKNVSDRTNRRRLTRTRDINSPDIDLETIDLGEIVSSTNQKILLKSARKLATRYLSPEQIRAKIGRMAWETMSKHASKVNKDLNIALNRSMIGDNASAELKKYLLEPVLFHENYYVTKLIKNCKIKKLNYQEAEKYIKEVGYDKFNDIQNKLLDQIRINIWKIISKYGSRWEFNTNHNNLQTWISGYNFCDEFYKDYPDYICDKNRKNKKFIKDFFLKHKGVSRDNFPMIKGPMHDKGNRMYGGNWFLQVVRKELGDKFKDEIWELMGWRKQMVHTKKNTLKIMKNFTKTKSKVRGNEFASKYAGYLAHAKREGYYDEVKKILKLNSNGEKIAKELITGTSGTYAELADYFSKLTGKKISKAVVNIAAKSERLITSEKHSLFGYQFKTLN